MNGEQVIPPQPDTIEVNGSKVELTPLGIANYISGAVEWACAGLAEHGIGMHYLLTIYPHGNVDATWMTGNDPSLERAHRAAKAALGFVEQMMGQQEPAGEV